MIAGLSGIGPWGRNVRLLAPLCALLSFAVLAIVLTAQTGLAFCGNRVALPGPMADDMPGMAMVALPNAAPDHQLMICPVVLVLIVASAVLAVAALVVLWLDPDRAFTRSSMAHGLARLPLLRSVAALVVFGAGAVSAMIAVDGAGPPAPATCAILLLLTIAGALAAVGASTLCARVVLALGRRLLIAIASAIADRRVREKLFLRRSLVRNAAGTASRLFAARRGLRAPPSFVR
jgi:hypothetical protein